MGGSQVSPSLPPTAGGTILEAEKARAQDGNIQSSITGHTGSGYVDMNGNGSSITFTHNASGEEQAILEFRYILDGGSENMNITVNGTSAGTLEFWDTGGPSSWGGDRKAVTLKEGANTIVLQSQGGAPKVDHLNILKGMNTTSAGYLKGYFKVSGTFFG